MYLTLKNKINLINELIKNKKFKFKLTSEKLFPTAKKISDYSEYSVIAHIRLSEK